MNDSQQVIERLTVAEDEIDLAELFRVLIKRKWLILGLSIFTTVLSLAYVFIKTPIYEVKSNLQIGFIANDLVAEPGTLVQTLKIIYDVAAEGEKPEKFISAVTAIKASDKLPNFIEIRTEGISNEEALKKNQEVVNYIQSKYAPVIEQFLINRNIQIENLKKDIIKLEGYEKDNLERQIKVIETQSISKIDEQIKFLKEIRIPTLEKKIDLHTKKLAEYIKSIGDIYKNNDENIVPLTVSSTQIVSYQNLILNSQNRLEDLRLEIQGLTDSTIIDLERSKEKLINDRLRQLEYQLNVELDKKREGIEAKIEQLKYSISGQNVQNSKVVGSYLVKDGPTKPKKPLILAIGLLAGLMLGVFLVFFLEFIKNMKEQLSQEETKVDKKPVVAKEPSLVSTSHD